MLKDYMAVKEAAALAGVGIRQIRYLLTGGTLKGVLMGGGWLVERKSLVAYLNNRPKTGPKKH